MFLHLSLSHSVHGGSTWAGNHPWAGTPPGKGPPPGQVHAPRQVHSPQAGTPPGQVPPLPQQVHPPAVVDPGFSQGGSPTPKSAVIFQYFPQKLHENERICTPGGHASLVPPPLDPPMPWAGTPQSSACWEIRATSGRYASYWNAFLLTLQSHVWDKLKFVLNRVSFG